MAEITLGFNACGGSSTSQKFYWGKANIVTGDAPTGTGWTLWGPVSASLTGLIINGLDDNVDYVVHRYCNCPTSGDTGPEIGGPFIKNACPSFTVISPSSNSVSYTISIPVSVNNAGTWIQRIVVELLDSGGTNILQNNFYSGPFSSSLSGSFTGLTISTDYKLRIKYSTTDGSRTFTCGTSDFQTVAACVAPTVTLGSITATTINVSWSVPITYAGDSYNIALNGSTVASGLTLGSSPYTLSGLTPNTLYQVTVTRNCGFGGSSFTNASATTASSNNVLVDSTLGGSSITVIGGITGFILTETLEPGEVQTGTHSAFTGVIQYSVGTGPALNGHVILRKNGIDLQCKNIAQGFTGSDAFTSASFTASDYIEVRFNTGNCI